MTNSVSKLETENVCIVLLLLLYFSYYTLLLFTSDILCGLILT